MVIEFALDDAFECGGDIDASDDVDIYLSFRGLSVSSSSAPSFLEFMSLLNKELLFFLNLGLIGCNNGGTLLMLLPLRLAWNPL